MDRIANEIAKQAGLEGNWSIVDRPPINPSNVGAPPNPNLMNPYFQGSLSPAMQHDAVFVGTEYQSPRVPQSPLMPVSASGVPNINSAIKSGNKTIIQTVSGTSVDLNDLNWRGNWVSSTAYGVNDLVQFNISTYLCLIGNTNVEPDTDSTKWVLVSKNINLRPYSQPASTIAFLQSAVASFGSTSGGTQAFSGANGAGNTIVVLCTVTKAGTTNPGGTFAISDSNGNTYQQVGTNQWAFYTGSGNAYNIAVFIASNIKGGSNSVTMTASGMPNVPGMVIMEFTGNANASPFIGEAVYFGRQNPSLTTSSVTLTTTQSNQIVVLWTSISPSGGFPAGFSSPQAGVGYGIIANASTAAYSLTGSQTQLEFGIVLTNADPRSSSGTYYPSDVVIVNGVTYICIKQAPPGTLITDTTHWAVLAAPSVSIGQVNSQSNDYTLVPGDAGKLVYATIGTTLPAFVQGAGSAFVASVTSSALAFPSANTAGNMLVVIVQGSTTTSLTISDTNNNTWVQLFQDSTTFGATNVYTVWYALNCAAGANTVTVSWTGAHTAGIAIAEYFGIRASSALDQSATTHGSGTTWLSPSITTTANHELVLAFPSTQFAGSTLATAPFATRESITSAGQTYSQIQDDVNVAAGSFSATGTQGASGNWIASIASFFAPASTSAITFTLPATIPNSSWFVLIENGGAGKLTINPNGFLLDGNSANIDIPAHQGIIIFTDGFSYFSLRGFGDGITSGFGNGAAGTAVTTTLLGTGSGPATPQTVKNYVQFIFAGSTWWIPLMQ